VAGAKDSRPRRQPAELLAIWFAGRVARTPDERLERAMRGVQRPFLLRRIFGTMPRTLNREAAEGVNAVIDFRIGGRRDGGEDHYQVVIEDSRCTATRRPTREPNTTLKTGGAAFLKLVTGNATGPELFMTGRLGIEGDLMLATRIPTLFRVPEPPRRD
jgi:putative sterol carrier protein